MPRHELAPDLLRRDPDGSWQRLTRMLETLDVHDGVRVLEIGTGTGYNAALLAHRLGDDHAFSVDVEPDLVDVLTATRFADEGVIQDAYGATSFVITVTASSSR